MTDDFEAMLDEAIESVEAAKRERERKAEEERLDDEHARSQARTLAEEVVAPAVSSAVEPIRDRGHWAYADIESGDNGGPQSWPSIDFQFWPHASRDAGYAFHLHITVRDGQVTFRESSTTPWGRHSGMSRHPALEGDDITATNLKRVIAEFVKDSLGKFTGRT